MRSMLIRLASIDGNIGILVCLWFMFLVTACRSLGYG